MQVQGQLPSSQEQLDRERSSCTSRLARRSGPKAQSVQNLSTCRQIYYSRPGLSGPFYPNRTRL